MRAATASGASAPGFALGWLSTSLTSSRMLQIGTTNASRTTTMSCCGVLMNDVCCSCVLTGCVGFLVWGKELILARKSDILRAVSEAPVAQRIRVFASEAKG